jgi:hypothetical protein
MLSLSDLLRLGTSLFSKEEGAGIELIKARFSGGIEF